MRDARPRYCAADAPTARQLSPTRRAYAIRLIYSATFGAGSGGSEPSRGSEPDRSISVPAAKACGPRSSRCACLQISRRERRRRAARAVRGEPCGLVVEFAVETARSDQLRMGPLANDLSLFH